MSKIQVHWQRREGSRGNLVAGSVEAGTLFPAERVRDEPPGREIGPRDLRRTVVELLGPTVPAYTTQHATYDLRRLCRKGLLYRPPGSHRYVVTPYGWKVALFYARLDARVLRPALTALEGQGIVEPHPKLSRALAKVDHELDKLIQAAFPAREHEEAA